MSFKRHDFTLKDLMRQKDDEPAFDAEALSEVLGAENMPPLSHASEGDRRVSRIRVIKALAQKYGPNYKSYPKVSEALNHYDNEVKYHKIYHQTMGVRHGR